jgi:predicted metal-binding protein
VGHKAKPTAGSLVSVPTGWRETLLICRKCSKKLDGGFGESGDLPLRAAVRAHLRKTGQRRSVGVLEVGCFGLCPKRAVTVARSRNPGEFLVIGAGADAALLLRDGPSEGLVGATGIEPVTPAV